MYPAPPGYDPRVITGIDHLVIAVPDLDAAAAALEREVGLAVGAGGRHERWGTANRLAWLGDSYVELLEVWDPALARESWIGTSAIGVLAGAPGGGFASFGLASDALEQDAAMLRARSPLLGPVLPGERARPDGRVVRWSLALPTAIAPTVPFLIQHDETAAEWTPAERAERAALVHPAAGGAVRLTTLEIPVEDVAAALNRLLRIAGLRFRPSLGGRGARDADVGPQTVRIRPVLGDDAGIGCVIHLTGPGLAPRTLDLLGCRWVLGPA